MKAIDVNMSLIGREELREKLDRHDTFKLVMVLGEWAFRAKRIPGSINITTPEAATDALHPGDEIVGYSSHVGCTASRFALRQLEQAGYANVRRYAGGIADWEEAGYPMEGEWNDDDRESTS